MKNNPVTLADRRNYAECRLSNLKEKKEEYEDNIHHHQRRLVQIGYEIETHERELERLEALP